MMGAEPIFHCSEPTTLPRVGFAAAEQAHGLAKRHLSASSHFGLFESGPQCAKRQKIEELSTSSRGLPRCLVQVERWPGSWFWAKIVGVYAGDGPLRERVHGGEDTARVVIPGVDDWELDVPLTELRRGGGRDPAAPERSRRRVMCVGSLPVR